MADINTLYELVKELNRGGVVCQYKDTKMFYTAPRHLAVKSSLIPSALMRNLIRPVNSHAISIVGAGWLIGEKNKLRREARREKRRSA